MHEAEFEHDHEEIVARGVDVEGLERLTLTSVGIDIGSSTSQVLFSRLTLRRDTKSPTGEFKVGERQVLWASPILLTPYRAATTIDFEAVRDFIGACYHDAGLENADIDTGAVLITGEALKKENARPIVEHFSQYSGKFICASAGPHHEALLAAHGSGSVRLSEDTHTRVLNVDIGGGTTKLSLVVDGHVAATAALSVGARLIAFDKEGRVTRLEDAGARLAREAGVALSIGSIIDEAASRRIGEVMAGVLIAVLREGADAGVLVDELMITPPLVGYRGLADIDRLVFSGGVSEYVYGRTHEGYGDFGPQIGAVLRRFVGRLPAGVLSEAAQGIRATVIGASEYTVQVSGATSFFTPSVPLPAVGQKVIPVSNWVAGGFRTALGAAFANFDLEGFGPGMVISLSLEGEVDYRSLREVAEGLAEAAGGQPACPLIITLEQDVAKALGNILKAELNIANDLLCIDGISVGDLDYIDVGLPIGLMELFPVTVKSLLFSSGDGAGRAAHVHHHHHGDHHRHGHAHHHHGHDHHGHDHHHHGDHVRDGHRD